MLGDPEVAGDSQLFNSTFLNWASAGVVNPKNGFHFCDGWFVTSVTRGRPMDIALEPLNGGSDSGFRLVMRDPPEQVRIWHRLPERLLESGTKFIKVRLRGTGEAANALQLDSAALFHGNEADRKIDRRLVGAIALKQSWHEFTAELKGSGVATEGDRYLSLRFSGKGTIEVEFCRLEASRGRMGAWPVAKSMAAKVLSGFPRRRTVPDSPAVVEQEAQDGSASAPSLVSARSEAGNVSALTADQSVKAPPEEKRQPKEKLSSSVVPERRQAGPNLLQNSAFLSWSGKEPEHWKVSLPNGVSLRRTPLSADIPLKTAGISFTSEKTLQNRTISLSQRIVGGLRSRRILDIAIVGYADIRTEVEVSLMGRSTVGAAATTTITLWPGWRLRTARIAVPLDFADVDSTIALAIPGGQAKAVKLAFVAAGSPGEDIAGQFEVRELAGIDSNALINGKFDHWSGPVRRSLSTRRTDITEEWLLVNKSPSPGVEARLTEIVPRGLRDGREHKAVLGLAMHGELSGPYVRMEASLDVLQIVAGPPQQLRLYARTALPSSPEAGTPRDRPMIQQVFVAERRRLTPDSSDFEVTRLFTVKRNLRISRIGEPHVIDLRSDHRALLLSKAKEMLHDVSRSLLLIFECSGFADVAIGDVYLGNNATAEQAKAATTGEVALEDPNIAAQLAHLKGVAHWRSPLTIAGMPYEPRAASPEPASWTWFPDSRLTVDIVICVHNAVEETLDCLASLQRHTTVPHTVTVIDDKSNDLTRERLRLYVSGKPWIRLLENPQNLGYTRSANIGLSSSSAEWVVLLNSDTVVTPGWLEGLFDVVKARPGVAMIGPVSNAASWQSVPDLHDVKGGWSINPIPEGLSVVEVAQLVADLSPKEFPEATLLNGFCTMMRRDVIEQVGYLDEVAFPMGYGEENDLCLRVRKAGYSLAVADHVYVYHVKSASFGSARRSELSKRGTAQLHAKHPDVDMKEVQREMAELTSLITLRKKLRKSFGSATIRGVHRLDEERQGLRIASSLTH